MMTNRRTFLGAMVATGILGAAPSVRAQSDTAIKMIVGFSGGGPGDFAVRVLAEKMAAALKRPVVVTSVPGAGSQIALQQLKRSPPDGNSLIFVSNSLFTVFPQLYDVQYDPVKDFTPIASVAKFDNALAVAAGGPKSLKELMAWIKEHPGEASFGTPGAGSQPHLLGTALGNSLRVKMVHVPYKSVSTSVTDLMGGRLPLLVTSTVPLVEMHRTGKVRVLAVSSSERNPLLPDVPTLKEAGFDMSMVITNAVFGPAGMRPELVRELNSVIVTAVNSPEVHDLFLKRGVFPAASSPKALAQDLLDEAKRLKPIIATIGPVSKD
jgi:tripartite-type tricarboxylate transporter receptor subunit TctC